MFLKNIALKIPAIRRIYDSRNALLIEQSRLLKRLGSIASQKEQDTAGRFFYYHANFNALETILRHSAPNLSANESYLTNYLGVVIDPKFFPTILTGRAGQIEEIPIPANWHADIAEWAAALRAVDIASDTFTMIELGCGWGCWMNNTGSAARRRGLSVHLIGIEGDEGHIAFAREACAANGFEPSEVTLRHGIAAPQPGMALFPRQEQAGVSWALEPVFHATAEQQESALSSGNYNLLPMISLSEIIGEHQRIDLLHIDIQGGETDFVSGCLPLLSEKVAYMLIGTHSRQIEGRLFDMLLKDGWLLEIERPAVLTLDTAEPFVTVDGVQGWRNPRLV